MESILEEQIALGGVIEQVLRSYRNEAPEKKNASYLTEKTEQLSKLWKDFDRNNSVLQKWEKEYSEVDYFKSSYHGEVRKLVSSLIDEMSGLLKIITSRPSGSGPGKLGASDQQGGCEGLKEQTSGRGGMLLRCLDIMITTLRNLLKRTEERLATDQPAEFKECQLHSIQKQWQAIQAKHLQILNESDLPAEYQIDSYTNTESWVEEMQLRLMQPQQIPYNGAQSAIKLPRIELPKFSGNYLAWQEFHDLFTQLIDQNNLGAAQKLWYLKSNLTGEAEALIRHLSICDGNYEPAWRIITERYQNKRLLVNSVLSKLVSQPTINGESAQSIKSLHDVTQECVRGLQALDIKLDHWDPILVFLLVKKMDRVTHVLFEQSLKSPRDIPAVSDFLNFLELRFQSLEALGNKTFKIQQRNDNVRTTLMAGKGEDGCKVCKESHPINRCEKFVAMTLPEKRKVVTKHDLCFNCLRHGHSVKACNSRCCLKCDKKHHTLLHQERKPAEKAPNSGQALTMHIPANNTNDYVFLGTANVYLTDKHGQHISARALLDSGSQLSFITEKLYKRLGITSTASMQNIMGIGNVSQKSTKRVNLNLISQTSKYSTNFEAFVLKDITSKHPEKHVNISDWPIPKEISLADPAFYKPQDIDVLLGAELFCSLITAGKIVIGEDFPTIQNSVLGWIILGKLKQSSRKSKICGVITSLEKQLERFWEIEEVSAPTMQLSKEDMECETFFSSTTTRNNDGRYIVRLPFTQSPSNLGQSKQIALQRLNGLQRRFNRHPELRKQYSEVIQEFLRLGHLEPISDVNEGKPHYYLPHHCVLRPESLTTKLRVVFDGSAKTTTNIALNDILQVGPKTQSDLFGLLLRFRTHRYVITADIQKMYRQVLLHEQDRKFHLILWRENSEDEVKTYQLKTVTYGTRSAPYLATRCLNQLAQDESSKFPMTAEVIKRDFYVDDLLTGSDDLKTTMKLQQELSEILKKGGFELHKWCSNNLNLLHAVPARDRATEFNITSMGTDKVIKTLGIIWNPVPDEFNLRTSKGNPKGSVITKRTVLSEMSELFDPLGLVNPVIVLAKIFMQQLWELKLEWDTPLPDELQQKWMTYRMQIPALNSLKIPRRIRSFQDTISTQLHGFSDASERAYGACIYIRSKSRSGQIAVFLLCSKSRVAPSKRRSIARLELCASLLLANLMKLVKSALQIKIDKTFYWTDSQIVLQWIASPPSKFTTFVANRVAAIQELTKDDVWQHIQSSENPADIVSRGMLPAQLLTTKLWFNGPDILKRQIKVRPIQSHNSNTSMPEEKKTKFVLTTINNNTNIVHEIEHNNNFQRLKEVLAFVLRFASNCKLPKEARICGRPTPIELDTAVKIIVREMQEQDFSEDIKHLKSQDCVSDNSKLQDLKPFLDEDGIIRVGGRVQNSKLPFKAKHAMLIASTNPITKLIFAHYHQEWLHAGPQTLLFLTRQMFWCIKGKHVANATVRQCVRCARARPQILSQLMGNLPAERIQQSRPFLHVGVDFCGPIQIHFKLRGNRPVKSYIAVFICFSTKAVHLELVSDLSSAAFIGCLKRFIARRGRPAKIFCDNATNFVGAHSELEELSAVFHQKEGKEAIETMCSNERIQWLHIPPRSPHFGGLWEAAVKSAKYHLKRVLESAALTYEELHTTICQIEAILNSRPITPMSSDPNDLQALSPGHFLIGQPLTTLAEPMIEPSNMSIAVRWKLVRCLHSEFWRRWSREYLQQLQPRNKWQKTQPDIDIGALVLLRDKNLPPLQWRMGRIEKTITGPDNHTRVVMVKTSSGTTRRAIQEVCPLPSSIHTPELSPTEPVKDRVVKKVPKIAPVSTNYPSLRDTHNVKRKKDDTNGEKQGVKKGKFSVLHSLLCIFLVLPVVKGSDISITNSSNSIEVTPFRDNPGIFFEDIGQIRLTHSTWKIITFYDLTGYWIEYAGLTRYLTQMTEVCASQDKLENITQFCNVILSQFQHQQIEIQEKNELMYQHHSIKRRSPLNIIGTAAHLLFGVLDEDFAKKYEEDIERTRANEKYLLKLVKNQTSIIDGTLSIFKRNTESIHQQFKFIETQLQELRTATRKREELAQVFNLLALQTSLLLHHLQKTQDAVLQLLTNTYQGKIHPLLLNAAQLRVQLQIMREHLPAGQIVPVNPGSVQSVYSIATVRTRTTAKNIIFDIQIPLVSAEQYQLIKLYPVPTQFKNTSVQIKPSTTYLAVTMQRDKYYPLSDIEKDKCHQLEAKTFICNQQHPIYTRQSNISRCEFSLLTHATEFSSTCEIQSSAIQDYWIQLATENNWIFVLKNQTTVDIICGKEFHSNTISGSGILRVKQGCIISNQAILISGHTVFTDKAHFRFAPIINLSQHIEHYPAMFPHLIAPSLPLNFSMEDSHLQNLTNQLRDQMNAELPDHLSTHDKHNYIVNYTSITIIFIATLLYGVKQWLRYKPKNNHQNSKILEQEFKVAEDVRLS